MPLNRILKGWDYLFNQTRPQRDDGAQRAGFLPYQTYPVNNVQGGGTLVSQMGSPGKYFNVIQSPQVIINHRTVRTSIVGGGTAASGIVMQPLQDTSNSIG